MSSPSSHRHGRSTAAPGREWGRRLGWLEQVSAGVLPRLAITPALDASTTAAIRDLAMAQTRDLLGERWRLNARLGRGGQGTAWRAVDTSGEFDGECVVKCLHSHPSNAQRTRFRRERDALDRLRSSRIPPLLDAALEGSTPFIVTPYRGETLKDWWPRQSKQALLALCLLQQAVEGIQVAHDEGIAHRDLKPGNLVVSDLGELSVIDWGLSRLMDDPVGVTQTRDQLGPRGFLAPECEPGVSAAECGRRADLYSLGKVLFWMCSDGSLIPRENVTEAMARVREARPVLREHLHNLIARTVREDPEQRPTTDELADLLEFAVGRVEQIEDRAAKGIATVWDTLTPDDELRDLPGHKGIGGPDSLKLAQAFHTPPSRALKVDEIRLRIAQKSVNGGGIWVRVWCERGDDFPDDAQEIAAVPAKLKPGEDILTVPISNAVVAPDMRYWVVVEPRLGSPWGIWYSASERFNFPGCKSWIAKRVGNQAWQAAQAGGPGYSLRVLGSPA